MIALTLPWPPTVNTYWRNNRGRTHISAEGVAFRRAVAWLAKEAKVRCLKGRLSLSVEAAPPDRRRRDLDNLLKSLLDALQHAGCYEDDSQIDFISVMRLEPVPAGRVVVKVGPAP